MARGWGPRGGAPARGATSYKLFRGRANGGPARHSAINAPPLCAKRMVVSCWFWKKLGRGLWCSKCAILLGVGWPMIFCDCSIFRLRNRSNFKIVIVFNYLGLGCKTLKYSLNSVIRMYSKNTFEFFFFFFN